MRNSREDLWTAGDEELPAGPLPGCPEGGADLRDNPLFRAVLWHKKRRATEDTVLGWLGIAAFIAFVMPTGGAARWMFPVGPMLGAVVLALALWRRLRSGPAAAEEFLGAPKNVLLDLYSAGYPARDMAAGFLAARLARTRRAGAGAAFLMLAVPLGAVLVPAAFGANLVHPGALLVSFMAGVMIVIHGPFRAAYALETASYITESLRSSIIPKKEDLERPSERKIGRLMLVFLMSGMIMLVSVLSGTWVLEFPKGAYYALALWAAGALAGVWIGRRARRRAPIYFAAMERDFRDLLYWMSHREHEKESV